MIATAPAAKTVDLARRVCALIAPPPKLTVSGWADARRMLPQTAAEPGRWRTDRTPYLRALMDACADATVRKIVAIFASQTGKSEGLLNITGYFIDYDPANILMIQPTVEMAEAFSKDRVAPMLADSPTLAERVIDPRSRQSGNTILRKEFHGGSITLVGANAPAPLASRFIRVVLADEVDRFPVSAGTEGDPLKLAEVRQTTFYNALTVVTSTPTVKSESRIETEYEDSTQEEWCVPCPSCGCYQPYEWPRLSFESVEMACAVCGVLHSEYEWKAGTGEWVATAEHPDTRGFRLNAMASPWLSWSRLISEFREANDKGPEVLKTFINTRLAESWEEQGEKLNEELLSQRRHYYECDVPAGVAWITAGVDVQADRLEVEVVGWGPGKESWGIEYAIIPGDPHKSAVWSELDAVIQRSYSRTDGVVLPISGVAVDSGYATSDVYSFCRKRTALNVFAIKGVGGVGVPVVGAWTRKGKNRDVPVFPVGTDGSKDLLFTRLSVESEGAGYCHFPRETLMSDGRQRGYGEDYFKGMLSERRVPRRVQGRTVHTWVKRGGYARNEPLDCRVYATAALEIRNPDLGRRVAVASAVSKQSQPRRRGVLSKGIS